MVTNLLLITAGAFWTSGAIGAAIWLLTRRQACRASTAHSDGASCDHRRHAEVGGAEADDRCNKAGNPDLRAAVLNLLGVPSESQQSKTAGPSSEQALQPAPRSLRFPYPCRQWAAPYRERCPPQVDDFSPVECHELYDNGISFYTSSVCETDTVAVSLGTRGTLIFMLAQVVRRQLPPDPQSTRTLWECQFIRRLYEDADGWASALGSVRASEGAETVATK
ncbi:MAG: hypothetical protein B7Z73_02340 [Planctomycetia bacterium 21-64-5]|nr:MAG: hypothetical protein B7Z73_02340 [Planctomycetia bacterium 21-64-5]